MSARRSAAPRPAWPSASETRGAGAGPSWARCLDNLSRQITRAGPGAPADACGFAGLSSGPEFARGPAMSRTGLVSLLLATSLTGGCLAEAGSPQELESQSAAIGLPPGPAAPQSPGRAAVFGF